MGSYHSLTPCASSDGTIISMSAMKRIVRIDQNKGTFTAEAGLQFIEASRALRARKLQFMTNIEIGNMTLGAAACCHTKDGLDGGELGQVGSYVTQIKWVTPAGELAEASAADNPKLLRLMRSSYGLCGVVYEVTFRIKPLEAIEFNYLPRPIKDLTEREVDQIIDASSGLICWTVGRKAHFQTRKRIDRVGPFGSLFAAGRRKLWNHTEARVGRFIDRRIPTRTLRNGAHNAWFAGSKLLLSTLRLTGGATLYNPDKTIDYSGTKASAKYAFTFWAFPRAQWLGALRDYLVFSEQHSKKYDFRCNMALGSYIRKDASSLPSYTHDGDIFPSTDPPTRTSSLGIDLKEFNEFAYKRNGIHLNQSPLWSGGRSSAYGAGRVLSGSGSKTWRSNAEPFFAALLS
jgi:hypothetical protein